jgi:hypothetical protein
MDEPRTGQTADVLTAAILKQAAQEGRTQNLCWFCGAEQPAVKEHWAGVHLEKVVRQSTSRRESNILNVPVPRCESCYRIHRRMTWVIRYTLIAFFAPIVLMMLGIAPETNNAWFYSLMEFIMLSALVVLALGTALYHITFPKHTHRRNYEHQYPAVLEAKRQGYLGFWGRFFQS